MMMDEESDKVQSALTKYFTEKSSHVSGQSGPFLEGVEE